MEEKEIVWRRDKRTAQQMRPLKCDCSVLTRSDGSARYSVGNTAVLASVYGPADVDGRRELVDRAAVSVTVRPVTGQDGPVERELEESLAGLVRAAVLTTMYPRTLIAVTVQVLHDDGGLLAAAANAVMLALMDAGVALKSLLSAACCALCVPPALPGHAARTTAPVLVLDPSAEEEALAQCTFTFAFAAEQLAALTGATAAADVAVAFSHTRGVFDYAADCLPAVHAAVHAAKVVAQFFRLTVTQVQQATKGTMLDMGTDTPADAPAAPASSDS